MLSYLNKFIIQEYLFREKLDEEIRKPFLTFQIHERIAKIFGLEPDSTFGMFAPCFTFWNQLSILLLCATIYGIFTAGIVYKLILLPRKNQNSKPIISSYIIGYGFILPMTILMPQVLIEILDIRNMIQRFVVIAIMPTLIIFRTSEAVNGFTQPSTISSFSNYAYYFASALAPVYCNDIDNNITVQNPSKEKIFKCTKYFLVHAVITGFYTSLFEPFSFEPLNCDIDANLSWDILTETCRSNILVNNIVGAGLLQLYLTTFIYAVAMITMVVARVDVDIEDTMKNPLLTATSPSDFWGRKWNLIVHGALKRGVFKPVYKYASRNLALFACFLASGLLHEFLLFCLYNTHYVPRCFYGNEDNGNCHVVFSPSYGKQTAFFLWNAVLVGIEMVVVKNGIFKKGRLLFQQLPAPIKSFFIIMTALPVAHWFLHGYLKSNLVFVHGGLGFPIVRKLHI